jgi:hypothetical protein
MVSTFVEDQTDWLARLRALPESARTPVLRVLEIAAAADTEVQATERRILAHAAEAVQRTVDDAALDSLARQFADTGAPASTSSHGKTSRTQSETIL